MTRLANTRHCFVCGLENQYGLHLVLESQISGHVNGRISIPRKFQGWPGIAHGGIIAAILDEAAGRTVEDKAIPEQAYVTGTLNVRYRQPVKCDIPLIIEAELLKRNGRVVTSKSYLLDEDRHLLAEAEGIFVQVEVEYMAARAELEDEWVPVENEENSDDH
jgi:acyl-coenzyme A thioesterase PaaI-like protein